MLVAISICAIMRSRWSLQMSARSCQCLRCRGWNICAESVRGVAGAWRQRDYRAPARATLSSEIPDSGCIRALLSARRGQIRRKTKISFLANAAFGGDVRAAVAWSLVCNFFRRAESEWHAQEYLAACTGFSFHRRRQWSGGKPQPPARAEVILPKAGSFPTC